MASSKADSEAYDEDNAFKCMTCYVMFYEKDRLLQHYKGDFHRYNLKRRATNNKAPISFAKFQEILQKVMNKEQEKEQENQYRRYYHCTICGNKRFKSENQLKQHLQTKKHQEMAKKQESRQSSSNDDKQTSLNDQEAEEQTWDFEEMGKQRESEENEDVDDLSQAPVEVRKVPVTKHSSYDYTAHNEGAGAAAGSEANTHEYETAEGSKRTLTEKQKEIVERLQNGTVDNLCPFDLEPVDGLYENIKRMYAKFGFNIPHIERVVDIRGMITHIFEKITLGQMCIYCDQGFGSVLATIHHMQSKNHFRLPLDRDFGDDMAEYEDFYDDLEATSEKYSHSEMIIDKDGELLLPSGKKLGHRDLRIDYRRKERPPEHQAIVANRKEEENRLLQKYGYPVITDKGQTGEIELHNARRDGSNKLIPKGLAQWRSKEQKEYEKQQGRSHQKMLNADLDKGLKTNFSNRLRFRPQYDNAG